MVSVPWLNLGKDLPRQLFFEQKRLCVSFPVFQGTHRNSALFLSINMMMFLPLHVQDRLDM